MGTFVISDFNSTDTSARIIREEYAADDFNRPNGPMGATSFKGLPWSQSAGAGFSIAGNMLKLLTIPTTGQATAWIEDPRIDGTVTATLAIAGGGNNKGLFFRGQGDGAGYAFHGSGTTYTLKARSAAGTLTDLATSTIQTRVGDVLSARMQGSNITCYVNGVQALAVTNSLYAGTRKGFWAFANGGNSDALVSFDDFSWAAL